MYSVYITHGEREKMDRLLVLMRRERHEMCGTESQIAYVLLSLALPQRFNSTVLRVFTVTCAFLQEQEH